MIAGTVIGANYLITSWEEKVSPNKKNFYENDIGVMNYKTYGQICTSWNDYFYVAKKKMRRCNKYRIT